jgi:molybdopterin molybdotransferase
MRTILSRVTPLAAETRSLRDCHGRILRQDVYAERDNPPFDRVCMDGVAIASGAFVAGSRNFQVQATQAAGDVPLTLAAPEAAIEVMTGTVLPYGTDSVIPLEEYDLVAGALTLKPEATAEPWRNIQRRGSDSQPGVAMLTAGMRLGAAEAAVVASAGLAEVQVSRQPRVTVISTGDELIEPGQPIADHQIRRSNAYGVSAALQLNGFASVADAHLPDNEALMHSQLGGILASNDVLVLSGGVSKGKFDFVPTVLKALGVEEVFYQVAQRPGRPMWFGVGPSGQLVFGLPGNPVSTLICLMRYVLPALRASMLWQPGAIERVALAEAAGGRKMTYFMPVTHVLTATSPGLVSIRPPSGSGDFLALAGTDGFVELPPQPEGYPEGFVADFYRW